jgi:non-specific serine/threonine protein kinase
MMGFDTPEETDDSHFLELNDVIEPIPDSWLAKWPRSHLHFDPNCKRLRPPEEDYPMPDELSGSEDEEQSAESSVGDEEMEDDDHKNVPAIPTDGAGEDDANDGDRSPMEAGDDDDDDGGPYISEPLEAQFDKKKPADISADEARVITSLIRQILRYATAERPTAQQLLEHEWFK